MFLVCCAAQSSNRRTTSSSTETSAWSAADRRLDRGDDLLRACLVRDAVDADVPAVADREAGDRGSDAATGAGDEQDAGHASRPLELGTGEVAEHGAGSVVAGRAVHVATRMGSGAAQIEAGARCRHGPDRPGIGRFHSTCSGTSSVWKIWPPSIP